MKVAETKTVPASEVRQWAAKKGYTVGTRGRLGAELRDAFNRAHRSKKYEGF